MVLGYHIFAAVHKFFEVNVLGGCLKTKQSVNISVLHVKLVDEYSKRIETREHIDKIQ